MAKVIGIVGSRRKNEYKYYARIKEKVLEILEEDDYIVTGGCPIGADSFAEKIARHIGVSIIVHHPNWKKVGKAAGFIRNTLIAEDADVLIAVVTEDRTGGTEDTIEKYLKLGKTDLILIY
jgi:hypothetical protein